MSDFSVLGDFLYSSFRAPQFEKIRGGVLTVTNKFPVVMKFPKSALLP
jgi:hypothetical protein